MNKKQSALLISLLFITHTLFTNIARDLELDAILNTINRTKTDHGKKALNVLLSNPTDELETLRNRQTTIAHICNTTHLHAQLTKELQQFNRYESSFKKMANRSSAIENAALSEFYFSSTYFKQWNYSPIGLELGQIAHIGNLCSSIIQHALAFAIFTWGFEEEHTCTTCAINKPTKHKKHSHKHDHGHDHHNHDHDKKCSHSHSSTTPSMLKSFFQLPGVKVAFQAWHGIAQIQELYAVQSIIRNNVHCIKRIQEDMIQLAHGIRSIKRIHALIDIHPEITTTIPRYKSLQNICNSRNISQKLSTLLELLEQPTFTGKPSAFSRVGNILAAYKLAQECAHELQPALDAIGEIDAYASLAQLLAEHNNSPFRYSFAHYNSDPTEPSLHAHNFWHPLLTTTMHLNSITLDSSNCTRNVILTGPNACGKSTNLKAITLCAYLAQTITLVPAQEYSQTVYKEIYSSIIVNDDIENNLSLFVTELTNAEQLLEKVEALAENEYMFIALDELFISTHHEKGQQVARTLLNHLHACPRVITVVSTHFEQLIELAHDNCCDCANYTVKNFVLTPGVGTPDDSFDIVQKKFTSRLLI